MVTIGKSERNFNSKLLYDGQTGVIEVRGGEHATGCVLLDNGVVKCKGSNSNGQLGRGNFNYSSQLMNVVGLPATFVPTTWPTKRPTRTPTSRPTKRPN